MKKNRFVILSILIFVRFLVYSQENKFEIYGKISPDFDGKKIKLLISNAGILVVKDSTIIDKGYFSFKGTENVNELSYLALENMGNIEATLILEKGSIFINVGKEYWENSVKGTPLNELYQSYCDTTTFYLKKVNELFEKGDGGQTTNNNTGITVKKDGNIAKEYAKLGAFTINYKKKNIANPVGKIVFKKELKEFRMHERIWDHGTDSSFSIIYNLADEKLKLDPIVLKYKKGKEDNIKREKKLKSLIGKKYLDINLITTTGKKERLSNYIGKSDFILIDFWASWCNPCIGAMPELKLIYDKYKNSGLKIIGISEDEDKESWLKMIKKIDAPWGHFMISNFSREIAIQLNNSYGLNSVPYCVIIDKKGSIIYVGSLPMNSTLESLLK